MVKPYILDNGVLREMTDAEAEEVKRRAEEDNASEPVAPDPVTLESLDNRLKDVEYIITGEVATNAQ